MFCRRCIRAAALFGLVLPGACQDGSPPPSTRPAAVARTPILPRDQAMRLAESAAREQVGEPVVFTSVRRDPTDTAWLLDGHRPGADLVVGNDVYVRIYDDGTVTVVRSPFR